MSRLALVASALLAGLAPAAAQACAVCTGGGEESKAAFVVTTVGMSVLPLAMLGGLGWWIWRRTKAVEQNAAPRGVSPGLGGSSQNRV